MKDIKTDGIIDFFQLNPEKKDVPGWVAMSLYNKDLIYSESENVYKLFKPSTGIGFFQDKVIGFPYDYFVKYKDEKVDIISKLDFESTYTN